VHLAVLGSLELDFALVDHAGFLPGTGPSGEILSKAQKLARPAGLEPATFESEVSSPSN
jgi:hypothetical protein